MKTVAYLRVSTGSQNLDKQKLAILDYARQKQLAVDRFVEVQASSRKGRDPGRTGELLDSLTAGDHLIVSDLLRLGRSLGQVIRIVEELVTRKIRFTAVNENIRFEGGPGRAGQGDDRPVRALRRGGAESDLGTDQGKAGRATGQRLGRPNGPRGKSVLDGKEDEIRILLEKWVSKASIAKILNVSRTAVHHFIETRKIVPG